MTYQTWFETTIAFRVEPTDTTIKLATAPTATNGRLYILNNAQEEWVSYTGVSGTSVTWVTRDLSKTADPATAWTGKTWIAWTTVRLVAMHDQMPDKKDSNVFTGTQTFTTVDFGSTGKFSVPVYATTTARDAAITSPTNWMVVYVTASWSFFKYEAGAWSTFASGSVPNATTTVAGKVELWTSAEGKAWTATWWSWPLVLSPDVLADVVQSWAWLYAWASATGNDSYVVTMTPACTAYVTGMQIVFKADVANTWACTINVNGLGAKSIKLVNWNDPSDWQIAANQLVELTYDWTNFVYVAISTVATSAMVTAWTNQSNFVTPYLLRSFANPYTISAWSTTITSATTSQNITAASYTKYKEIQATVDWTYTVEFTLLWVNGRNTFWRIYKNWTAIWTERNTNSAIWDQVYTENLSFVAWDLIQIYCYRNNTDFTPYVKNFYIKATISQNTALVSGNVILN